MCLQGCVVPFGAIRTFALMMVVIMIVAVMMIKTVTTTTTITMMMMMMMIMTFSSPVEVQRWLSRLGQTQRNPAQ